jgi:hypothetical protein
MVPGMSSRREVLKFGAAAAAASVALTAPWTVDAAPLQGEPQTPRVGAPWTLFAPYRAGGAIGAWTLAGLTGVAHGAVVLELRNAPRTARVHVCAHGGTPRGIVSTDRFDLLLMNGGDGATCSDEPLARTLAVLAAVMEANTDAALRTHPELAALLTHPERVAAFDTADCDVLA